MLVVMTHDATPEHVDRVCDAIRSMGFKPHPMPGANRTAIGITGNPGPVDSGPIEMLPGVAQCIRVTQPHKLVGREFRPESSSVRVGATHHPQPLSSRGEGKGAGVRGAVFGPGHFPIIAGPCAVENEAMIMQVARFLNEHGVPLMRAGAYKPRTSPYSFQGLGVEGLDILEKARAEFGVGVVTEVMDVEAADRIEEVADMLQVGARNMQNFALLRRVGRAKKPVLLKRGIAATVEEWLMAAEYILNEGNDQVVLCERGVRTFADQTRNTLDLSVVPVVQRLSHLPIIVDPSHGTGRRDYVPPMALAALACGANGLMVEIHPDPDHARSDGAQSMTLGGFEELLNKLRLLAAACGAAL
jgi:3-deoxy-7-phosphoheptulonate synthase